MKPAVTTHTEVRGKARAGHGGPGPRRATGHGGRRRARVLCCCVLQYGMQGAMSVAGPLPFPIIITRLLVYRSVWEGG
jgi:hypothetical protein